MIQYGICILSAVPMRALASDQSEMINQVLYGESFSILEQQEKWTMIELHHDKYQGWIANNQYKITNKKTKSNSYVTLLYLKKDKQFLPMGSIVDSNIIIKQRTLSTTAKLFLNTPYLWGGRTFMGIDCSGFIQIIYRVHGKLIPRDAYQQEALGKKILFKNAQENDIAFFTNKDGKVIHVGLVLKQKQQLQIIHASGKVRIDTLDEQGIFSEESKTHTHQLHTIKRI